MAYSATQEPTTKSASDIADDIGSTVKRATGTENISDKLSRQGRDAAENAQAVAGNMRAALDKSIQEQPMTTLLMAAAAGFLVGALWRS